MELRWPISRILAHAVYWLVIVFFLAAASKVLGLPGLVGVFAQVLLYLPLLLVWAGAGLVLYMASGLVGSVVASGARSAGLANAALLGRVARVVAITFASVIVIGQVGIDVTLLVNVVTIATAVFLGGAAVAFGIGTGGTARLIRKESSVADVLSRLRRDRRPGRAGFFVVDSRNRLAGWVDMQDLALAEADETVGDLAHDVRAFVDAMATREEVAEKMDLHRLSDLAVLDLDGRLVGVVRYAAMAEAELERASVGILLSTITDVAAFLSFLGIATILAGLI